MKHLFCEDRLRGLDLLSLEKKRLKEDLINVCTCRYLMAWSKDRARSFSLVSSERTSGHDRKLKHRKPYLNVRKKIQIVCSSTSTGYPHNLWSLHPWRYSKPDWVHSWATCQVCPCFDQGVGQDDLQRFTPSSCILYDSV